MNKIKINKIGEGYWYYPSIFTMSKNKWTSFPFLSISELFEKIELNNFDSIISINPNGALIAFEYAQSRWSYKFKITKNILNSLNLKYKNDVLFVEKLEKFNIEIIWTKKSIKKILSGNIPFICQNSLKEEFLTNQIKYGKIYWNGKRYDWFKK